MELFLIIGLFLSIFLRESLCVELYPFGINEGDFALPKKSDDISSPDFKLNVPITFYGQSYPSVYVNQNGLVSFLTQIPNFANMQFPLDYPAIAPLYTDIDTRVIGSIFYRESTSEALLQRSKSFISQHFSSGVNFDPKGLLIVTWDDVGSFDRKTEKIFAKGTGGEKEEFINQNKSLKHTNTFQLVIASDGGESYAIFIYDQIEWIKGSGKNPSLPDANAQAGLISGNGPHYELEGSGTDHVHTLHKRSNLGTPGVWGFKIGNISEIIGLPDENIQPETLETNTTCNAGGAITCHSNAECTDYPPGFCCKCTQGYYGNGKTCLEDTIPTRANGKVKGVLNGIAIQDADLYSYIMPVDARTFTAIAKIPERLGYEMQTTSVIGTIFGWLFSLTEKGAVNGFQITGGIFNYTAEIDFIQTGHKVTINQVYSGLDVFNNMRVDTRIHGTTAVVPVNTKIEQNDYEMLMTRVGPGVIRSKSNHNYRVEGTSMDNPFTIEQTITYKECPMASPVPLELNTIKMKVGRNYIAYDPQQEIVRYAITSTVTPLDGEDPCKENKDKCQPFSSCVADGNSYKCICNLGYEADLSDPSGSPKCMDIDECRLRTSDCDVTAHCTNTEGSYTCRCRDSYTGDGFTCAKIITCDDVQCGVNARCENVRLGEPECRCIPGYHGDGLWCLPRLADEYEGQDERPHPSEDDRRRDEYEREQREREYERELERRREMERERERQRERDSERQPECRICDPNAGCGFNPLNNSYVCQCRPGFYGNGTWCSPEESSPVDPGIGTDCRGMDEICDPYADCLPSSNSVAYQCVCRHPFVGNGLLCRDSRQPQIPDENPEPECLFGDQCWCPPRFTFDDLRHQCLPEGSLPDKTCEIDPSVCDVNAVCNPDSSGYRCVCNPGFDGDGTHCLPRDQCRSHAECGPHGECAYNRTELRLTCKCREKFQMVGNECKPGAEVGCDVLNDCDVNGRCVWDSSSSKFNCECKPGFFGSGRMGQCEEDMTGCNVLRNCARNAECAYDSTARAFRCHCRQGFQGDGYLCVSSVPCYQDRTVCDINAVCEPNQETREWKCQCKEGYNGNGFDCQEAGVREDQFFLLAKGMAVIQVQLDSGKSSPITVEPFQTAIGIDIDCPNERVYWSDVGGRMIKSSLFNGTSKAPFLTREIGSPEGLSLDWSSGNLYWTDSSKDTIEVANLHSGKRKTLISTDLVNPRGIAVYPQRGRVFWSDWNRDFPKIEFAGLDGFGRQTLIGDGLALPNSLVVDTVTDQLCFADAGTHRIECVGMDGRNRRIIVSSIKYPFGLTLGSEKIYWSDWNTTSIESASRRTGMRSQGIPVTLGGAGHLYGLVLVPKMCPQAYSPCSHNSCQSEYICLPNIRGGRSCRCTDSASPTCRDIL